MNDPLLDKILAFTENLSRPKQSKPEEERFKLINGNDIVFTPRLQVNAIALVDGVATSGIETLEDGRQVQISEGSIVHKVSYDRLSQDELKQIQDENNKQAESEARLINLKKYIQNKNNE